MGALFKKEVFHCPDQFIRNRPLGSVVDQIQSGDEGLRRTDAGHHMGEN